MPVYEKGKSPMDLMNRLPLLRLKESSGEGNTPIQSGFGYDSYGEGIKPQLHSKDYRGTIYVTSFSGSHRRDSTSTYEITLRAETLDWIRSAFLQRNKEWELTYGWTDDNITFKVKTTTIGVKFDSQFGGFELTLSLVTDGIVKQYSITHKNQALQKGIQGNKGALDIDTVMGTYLGEIKRLFGLNYSYNKGASVEKAQGFQFSTAEVNRLLGESNDAFINTFQYIIGQYGMRVKFDSDKKKVSITTDELQPNEAEPKWVFEYKTYDTEILELDFELVVQDVNIDKVTESLFVLRPSGEPEPQEQEITGEAFASKKVDAVEEEYSAGDEGSYVLSRQNIYLPSLRNGTIKVIGKPQVSIGDMIEIKGVDDLSGNYRVNDSEQNVTASTYTTTLKVTTINEKV